LSGNRLTMLFKLALARRLALSGNRLTMLFKLALKVSLSRSLISPSALYREAHIVSCRPDRLNYLILTDPDK
jgi:hypothetical protein